MMEFTKFKFFTLSKTKTRLPDTMHFERDRSPPCGMLRSYLGAFLLCLLSGCCEHTTDGSVSIYKFAGWMGPTVIIGGILSITIAFLIRKSTIRFAVIGLIAILLIVVAPAMYNDRVELDDEHFEARYGFWFNPKEVNLRFEDLKSIRRVKTRSLRGTVGWELHCTSKSDQKTVLHLGDLVQFAAEEIMEKARAKGVATTN